MDESKLKRLGHVGLTVFCEQLVFVWGGYMETNQPVGGTCKYHDPQEVLLYNPVSASWTIKMSTGQVPPANSGTCGVVVGEKKDVVYIYGGYFGDPDIEGNSNNIYQLNLNNWIWERLEPTGYKPLHRDKLLGWEFQNKIYFFSGFGTPPMDEDRYADHYEYISDRSHQWYIGRGWNNQLVAYDVVHNEWEWPETKGQTPSPRAALAGFRYESRIYIFGGRLKDARMNDLYFLDMSTMTWSDNLNLGKLICPRGRSWHSFTHVGNSSRAILYGGLSSEGDVLGDCWTYQIENNSWIELNVKCLDKRLWHQSVYIDSEIVVVGGVSSNILSNPLEPTIHAKKLLFIQAAPKSLLRLSLEFCSRFFKCNNTFVDFLPKHLLGLIDARRNSSC